MTRLYVVALVVVVVLIAAGVVAIVVSNKHQRDRDRDLIVRLAASDRQQRAILAKLETARKGECALRRERKSSIADLERQVRRTRAFLVRFPDGLQNIHVSRADIEQSIRSQEANIKLQHQTVKALSVVRCGG